MKKDCVKKLIKDLTKNFKYIYIYLLGDMEVHVPTDSNVLFYSDTMTISKHNSEDSRYILAIEYEDIKGISYDYKAIKE